MNDAQLRVARYIAAKFPGRSAWYLAKADEPDTEATDEADEADEADVLLTYEIADDLTDSEYDVAVNLAAAIEAFKAEQARGKDADLTRIEQIAADIAALKAEQERRDEAEATKAAKIEETRAALGIELDDDEADEADDEPGDDEEELVVEASEDEEAEPEALAAGGTVPAGTRTYRVRTRRPAAQDPVQEAIQDPAQAETVFGYSLVAAASTDSALRDGARATGASITIHDVAKRARDSHNAVFSHGSTIDGRRYLAQWQKEAPEEHTYSLDRDHNEAISRAEDDFVRAPTIDDFEFDQNGVVLTAGAACAIREEDFTLYDDSKTGTLLQLPSRVVPRGSLIQWEPGSNLCEVIDALATNIVADEESTKVEVELGCPTPMTASETYARYLIIRFNNFRARSAADTYEIEIMKHLRAHAISTHLDHLHAILTDASTTLEDFTAVGPLAQYPGSSDKDFWTMFSLRCQAVRNLHCLPEDYALDAVFPRWFPNAIRDAAAREMGCKPDQVSEATIRAMAAVHGGARCQFIDWWQRLDPADLEYPSWLDVAVMPANSWYELTQGTLNLGNEIRDATSNLSNTYTSFTEDFYTTDRRKYAVELGRFPLLVTGSRPAEIENPVSAVAGVDSTVRPAFS